MDRRTGRELGGVAPTVHHAAYNPRHASLSVQSIIGATASRQGLQAPFQQGPASLSATGIPARSFQLPAIPALGVPYVYPGGLGTPVATFQKRGDRWRALVRLKGMLPKSGTFPTLAMARTWATRLEREHAERQARGETASADMTLGEAIGWYVEHVGATAKWGRSKQADLLRLKGYPLAQERIADLDVRAYARHVDGRRRDGAGPATASNDLVWLRQVLRSARATLGVPANLQALDDAVHELRNRRQIAKSKARTRRLAPAEEQALLAHFAERDARSEIPMADVVRFALATGRRQEEITRLRWADLDEPAGIAWLDDVKHPRHKVGNRRAFRMLSEAWSIVARQLRAGERVFPFEPKSIGAAFTRACRLLAIHDLRFHDLRHEATSRLFERGYSIQEVALFTLHESWATLKRYANLRPQDIPERPTTGASP